MDAQEVTKKLVLDASEIDTTTQRLAFEILERWGDQPLFCVGIHTRGVTFARRVSKILKDHKAQVTHGTLDITLYRDDLDNLGTIPTVKDSELPIEVENSHIIIFDDVLFTGRTIRSAINVLMDYGRPAIIQLAVLVDRGNRELPICPDYTGRVIKTQANEYISVRFQEDDKLEGVYLLTKEDDA